MRKIYTVVRVDDHNPLSTTTSVAVTIDEAQESVQQQMAETVDDICTSHRCRRESIETKSGESAGMLWSHIHFHEAVSVHWFIQKQKIPY